MHERLVAVVPGPYCDAFGVEDLGDVVRMHACKRERDDAGAPVGGRPEEGQPWNLGQALDRVNRQPRLVLLDRLEPDRAQVVDRTPSP